VGSTATSFQEIVPTAFVPFIPDSYDPIYSKMLHSTKSQLGSNSEKFSKEATTNRVREDELLFVTQNIKNKNSEIFLDSEDYGKKTQIITIAFGIKCPEL